MMIQPLPLDDPSIVHAVLDTATSQSTIDPVLGTTEVVQSLVPSPVQVGTTEL